MAFYRMSGSSKGELHGASILVTVDGGTSGETVTLTKDTFSKSGVLSDDGTCLFTDLLEAGTYTATYQTFTASVEVSASDVLNKVTKSVTIAQSVTITLTLESAKEDNITITDPSGIQVGVCVFPTDSVTGTVEIEIPSEGGVYTFTSSVAKGTTEETKDQNYSKNVTLTKSSNIVYVMPSKSETDKSNVMYWYGNTNDDVTGGYDTFVYNPSRNSISFDTNVITIRMGAYTQPHPEYNNVFAVPKNRVTVRSYKKYKHIGDMVETPSGQHYIPYSAAIIKPSFNLNNITNGYNVYGELYPNGNTFINGYTCEIDMSPYASYYVAGAGIYTASAVFSIYALWLE